jgi:hypothetical protein
MGSRGKRHCVQFRPKRYRAAVRIRRRNNRSDLCPFALLTFHAGMLVERITNAFKVRTIVAYASGGFSSRLNWNRHRRFPNVDCVWACRLIHVYASSAIARHDLTGGSFAPRYSVCNKLIQYQQRHPRRLTTVGIQCSLCSSPYGHWCNETETGMQSDEAAYHTACWSHRLSGD